MHLTTILTVLSFSLFHLRISSYTFLKTPQNRTQFVGESASFDCEVLHAGTIFGASYWGYRFPEEVKLTMISDSSDNFTLIHVNDNGESFGHSSCILNTVTKEHRLLTIECGFLQENAYAILFVYSPPVLHLLEDRFEATRGQIDPLVVTFSTEGYPDPIHSDTFDWSHNSELLEDSHFISLTPTSVTITDPQSFHTGTYTLTTHTAAGNATAEFYIDVVYAPEGIGTFSLTEFAAVGEDITLYCEVPAANPPATAEWFKDNTSISLTEMLILTEISLLNHGLYICNISNAIGFITREVQLFVYGPPSSPVWNHDRVAVEATVVLFVWERPVETYGLEVDFYELLVSTQNTSTRFSISGYNLSYLLSYENGGKVYPDTVYTAVIAAYTYNRTIRGNASLPLQIRTLVSGPIVSSVTAHVSTTGIVIQWELYSSGLADTYVDYYQIELRYEGVLMVYHTQHTSFTVDVFESHSIYSITLFGVRNETRGSSLQTEVQTGGYGPPPTPLLLQTEERELENKTNVTITIKEVLTPYIDFSIHISCKQNNFTQRINLFTNISDFRGGNLSLTLNRIQQLNSVYSCTAVLRNIFGIKSLNFTFAGLKSTTTTTIIVLATTTTTPTSKPFTPFLTALIVVMVLLLLISICITAVIVVIVYLCVKSSMYEVLHSGKLNKEKGKMEFSEPGEGFEYEGIVEKLSCREGVEVDNTCETTSV